ncbi:hypothetical protein ACMV5I_10925 [Serratia sp. T13T92]|uniref:hypothetical protein n=1 Tax=Serratia sp. T13T92 TaxID=3397496 RepID=UPI0039DFECB2
MTTLPEKLTNAELRQIIDSHEKGHCMVIRTNADYRMAKELLAVREAAPYGYLREHNGQVQISIGPIRPADRASGYATPWGAVYAAPPALPGELLDAMAEVIRISDRDHEAWVRAKAAISACRAAMLQLSGNSEHVNQAYTLNSPAIPDGCDTMPNGQSVLTDDYFSTLVNAARIAADKAMQKHPQPNYVLLKVAEEAGEVVQAGVHYAEGRMTWQDLEGEIVQLLAMLIRLVSEGDQVNGINPPASCSTAALAAVPDEIDIFVDQVCGNLPTGHQQ